MKKRLVFKPWVEKLLTYVFGLGFVLIASINDFDGLGGFVAYLLIIATVVVSWCLLNKYGRKGNN